MKKWIALLLCILMTLGLLAGCGSDEEVPQTTAAAVTTQPDSTSQTEAPEEGIPPYSGEAFVSVNGNVPFFTEAEITDKSFESYAPLDDLGRCGTAMASVGQDLMPTEDRKGIGMVKPSGWQTVKYDIVDGKYLYNRCHLIGFQLTGENANEQNLITGTRYLNIEGMLPFENMVADHVKETGQHVMYRVTPVFEGNELVARGVLMEGYSVEDQGEAISFCVFAYNVQPGVEIHYADGTSQLLPQEDPETQAEEAEESFVLNTNSMKFHLPDCSSVKDIKPEHRKDFTGSRQELIDSGYAPCGRCHP